jgi:hypothetical protein
VGLGPTQASALGIVAYRGSLGLTEIEGLNRQRYPWSSASSILSA